MERGREIILCLSKAKNFEQCSWKAVRNPLNSSPSSSVSISVFVQSDKIQLPLVFFLAYLPSSSPPPSPLPRVCVCICVCVCVRVWAVSCSRRLLLPNPPPPPLPPSIPPAPVFNDTLSRCVLTTSSTYTCTPTGITPRPCVKVRRSSCCA